MAYHSTVYTNPQIRTLLRKAGIPLENFIMERISGMPARTKNTVRVRGNKVTVFGSDFVCSGYLKRTL